jgi:hypothetical protein
VSTLADYRELLLAMNPSGGLTLSRFAGYRYRTRLPAVRLLGGPSGGKKDRDTRDTHCCRAEVPMRLSHPNPVGAGTVPR